MSSGESSGGEVRGSTGAAAEAVSVRSGAKINPVLRVLGRRADGFHELETLMLGLGFGGVVTVGRAPGEGPGSIQVHTRGAHATADIVDGPEHLALRGAQAARAVLGRDDPLGIVVEKEVPSRAGLGGGSADAAAAARATLELLDGDGALERHGDAVLEALAAIGSDCAFFFAARGRSAGLATGRGERVEVLDGAPPWWVGVLTPDLVCSTPKVYGALGLAPGAMDAPSLTPAAARALLAMSGDQARAVLENGLEEAALRAEPKLAAWLDLVDEVGAGHMTLAGSGSSLFALFDDQADAANTVRAVLAEGERRGLGFRFACVTGPETHLLERLH